MYMSDKELKSFYNVGPGDYILDFMDHLGWNQNDLADITGLSLKSVNQLINNKQGITIDTAIILEKTFKSPAEFWLNIDAKYQLRKRQEQDLFKDDLVIKKALLRKYMPVLEMKKRGWFLYDIDSVSGIENECMRIFGAKNIPEDEYENTYNFYTRQTKIDYVYTKWYTKTWFEYAKTHAKMFDLPKYDRDGLCKIAESLFSYTVKEKGVENIIEDLSKCGIGFFVLSHLPKTYLDGAAFIYNENPFIVYTCRYDRIDNFWFVVAHEIAHILNHYNTLNVPIFDNLEVHAESDKEKEADYYAGKYLNQDKVLMAGEQFGKYLNAMRLQQIEDMSGVSIPVALGMLQHFGKLEWRQFSKYKVSVRELVPNELIMG